MPFKREVKPKPFHNADELKRKADEKAKSEQDPFSSETSDAIAEFLAKDLKPAIMKIAEKAFRRYCELHSADKALEDLEWRRFSAVLRRML